MNMNQPSQQNNQQTNIAKPHGQVIANNGSGKMRVRNVLNFRGARSWAGWALLLCVVADVVYPIYGRLAYTGQPNNSGDLWRAGIYLALLATTGTLIRRWLRRRF
ncbi:MAG TPA: hypothetical protein VHW44_06785 [Pseudonocardiaceae bacterium]|jgi:hypothetical protein|nr:hypothetical protein [Pseudonocardiaceae bacterium]